MEKSSLLQLFKANFSDFLFSEYLYKTITRIKFHQRIVEVHVLGVFNTHRKLALTRSHRLENSVDQLLERQERVMQQIIPNHLLGHSFV